jgi:hypothetical protein
MSEVESSRFIKSKTLVRDLCLREKDFIQSNRLWYATFVRDAFLKLNLKTQMSTKRIALPVIRGNVPYIDMPPEYLDLSSIAAEDHNGKLRPMIINTDIRTGIADMSLIRQCGCDACGCSDHVCASVKNFEDITGTVTMDMPDGTPKVFNTRYRKVIMTDGSYVEQKTMPAKIYNANAHIDTKLQTQERIICKLEVKECGCLVESDNNRALVEANCNAVNYQFECGCAVDDIPAFCGSQDPHKGYNIEEDGSRIYLSSDFRPDFVVVRMYVNSKTKDIVVPFLAKEAMMATIKELSTAFDKKEPRVVKDYWKGEAHQKRIELQENLSPVDMTTFYHKVLGRRKSPR